MLRHLSIRDVVLIDRAELSFGPGLSALTGETGAGKSILLDAFGLALGARADSGLIRRGAERASVTAAFAPGTAAGLRDLFDEHDLDPDPGEDLILRRSVGTDGRSRAFVNDRPVSVGLLRRIGDRLVEIHGQFERFSLAESANQRRALDAFAGLDSLREATAGRHRAWRGAEAARAEAARELDASAAEADELRGALAELEKLDPRTGEADELSARRRLLQNADRLTDALSAAADALAGDAGAEPLLQRAARALERSDEIAGGRLGPVVAAIDKSSVELAEAIQELNALAHALDTDTGDLGTVEERLFALHAAARRHGVDADGLPEVRGNIEARLAALDGRDDRLAELAKAAEATRREYCEAGEELSRKRRKAAQELDARIAGEFAPLKLDNASLTTRVERLDEASWADHGLDAVSFEVATNPETAPGPLGRIASGGELSRFMLALKAVLAGTSGAATIVFDEVDTGVGGATAAAVGERLCALAGAGPQILVVTHSPQVAAAAGEHLRVEKRAAAKSPAGRVATRVARLDIDERREEIARMLSGARITDEARAAAERLMARDPPLRRATA